jgi:hypothetical protein
MLGESVRAAFLADLLATADAYLGHSDPIRQSGFGGCAERWRAEREPILVPLLDPARSSTSAVRTDISWSALSSGDVNAASHSTRMASTTLRS